MKRVQPLRCNRTFLQSPYAVTPADMLTDALDRLDEAEQLYAYDTYGDSDHWLIARAQRVTREYRRARGLPS